MALNQGLLAAFAAIAVLPAASAIAQPAPAPAKPEMLENCPGLVAARGPRATPVSLRLAALAADQARISYVGHSTFLLESPRNVKIATDYNDYVKPRVLPDIVDHESRAFHPLHRLSRSQHQACAARLGADPDQPARHDIQVSDVRIRNVPTNIRSWMGGGTERHGNSIFIFEVANLCIAHLGHLHHTLNQQQLNEIGRIDVVMVPVDGGDTLDTKAWPRCCRRLRRR